MARARNIKPGFFKNEGLGMLPVGARLMFIGLWTLADRDGRLEDRPARIAAEIFPYDRSITAEDVNNWLTALAESDERFMGRYSVGNARYVQIANFLKHQSPHVKEQASTIPAPDLPCVGMVQAPDEHVPGQCVAPPDSLNPSSLNPSKNLCASDDARVGLFDSSNKTPVESLHATNRKSYQDELERIARAIHGRHPNSVGAAGRRDISVSVAEKLLAGILKHKRVPVHESEAYLRKIDSSHAAWCESEAWRKDDGQFVKSLRGWLAPREERYDVVPESALLTKPNARREPTTQERYAAQLRAEAEENQRLERMKIQ